MKEGDFAVAAEGRHRKIPQFSFPFSRRQRRAGEGKRLGVG